MHTDIVICYTQLVSHTEPPTAHDPIISPPRQATTSLACASQSLGATMGVPAGHTYSNMWCTSLVFPEVMNGAT